MLNIDVANKELNQRRSERRTLTESGLLPLMGRDFEQIFGQTVFIRVKKLSNENLLVSRHIKRQKGLHPLDVRRST